MATPYILARTFSDAHAFAQEDLDLERGCYRVVSSAASLSGVRNCDLHLVPGWEKRFDHFAMKGKLRYTRMNIIRHEPKVEAPPAPAPQPDGLIPAGQQLTLVTEDEASAFFNSIVVPPAQEPALDRTDIMQALSDEAASTEKPQWQIDLDAHLEPEGFTLPDPSDQAAVARSIIESAAAQAEPTEKPKRIRRKRCETCGDLVLPNEYEQHVSEHLPEGE